MKLKSMSLGPIGTNCYILHKAQQALIIDPGGDANKIEEYLNENNLTPLAVLLTHAHFDHIGAINDLKQLYNLDVYIHSLESDWLTNATLNGSSLLMGIEIKVDPASYFLHEGTLTIGTFSMEVIHTPGHSPGSVSFIFDEEQIVISGDVLFHRGIGRTDLPGGDFEQLKLSIANHLYTLPQDFVIYPGHGPYTTIGEEMLLNPFVSANN